jgi:hypothetical protein
LRAHVEASWDPELAGALSAGGTVLEEEAVAGPLLEELARR